MAPQSHYYGTGQRRQIDNTGWLDRDATTVKCQPLPYQDNGLFPRALRRMLQDNERRRLVAALRYPEEATHLMFAHAIDIQYVTAQRRPLSDLLGRLRQIGGIDLIPRTITQVTGQIHSRREDLTALHTVFQGALHGAPTRQNVQVTQIIFILVFWSSLILL